MDRFSAILVMVSLTVLGVGPAGAAPPGAAGARLTEVTIHGDAFWLNGQPTYRGRTWRGQSIEGLLLNSRMVQGIFDDLEPRTRRLWAYPDTGVWDSERDTRE